MKGKDLRLTQRYLGRGNGKSKRCFEIAEKEYEVLYGGCGSGMSEKLVERKDLTGALIESKHSLESINLWPEGDSNREIIVELLNAVKLLIDIELERNKGE